jgi:hypothetical protein
LWGQTFQGGIRGTVADTSGGGIADAKVTLVDEATGVPRATLTEAAGGFVFNSLTPATYSIVVERPGFKRLERKGIIVSTQEFIDLSLRLEVGQVSESVNVNEDTPLLETTNASTGQVIDREKFEDLPDLGRNPFMLAIRISQNTTPGGNPKFNRMEDQGGSSTISIAGGPLTGNNYLLDGISITNSSNQAVIIPTVEAVQEVKLQANTYDAEVGRTGGGTFNTFLKSGTNQLHGGTFGYLWPHFGLANTFFANAAGTPVINQPFYNYGVSLGGPVVVPKVYNGHNRTFFWISGEAYRQQEAASTVLAVPTSLEREGNFSRSLSTKGTPMAIYDPLSTVSDGNGGFIRTLFPGGIIPANRLNSVGHAMASYYPLPDMASPYYGSNNYAVTVLQYDRADQVTSKLDQEIKPWWHASASYLHYGSREPGNTWFPALVASPNNYMGVRHVDATQANSTFTVSPTFVVAVRWGFNRYPNNVFPPDFDQTSLGLPAGFVRSLPARAFPTITMSDLASYGGTTFGTYAYTFYSQNFSASASKFMGRHSLKWGSDFRAVHVAGTPAQFPGSYTFNTTFTQASPSVTTAGAGASLASMLLGYPASASVTTTQPLADFIHYWGFFVHDDFRITSKLTLNYGLRYEYETGIQAPTNAFIVGIDTNAINPIQSQVSGITTKGVIEYAGQNGYGKQAGNPNKDKISPRVGFAYSLNAKTTLRGGYGVFWAPIPFALYTPLGYANATPYVASNDNNATPANSLSNPFPTGLLPPVGNSAGLLAGIGGQSFSIYDKNARSTRVQQFSADIQSDLIAGFVVAAGYAGSSTSHLIQGTGGININQLPDSALSLGSALNAKVSNPFYGTSAGVLSLASPTIARAQTLLPFPQFGTVTLLNSDRNHARYDSLYAKVQKRLAYGLTVLTTYTWSRNRDASNAANNAYSTQPNSPQDNNNTSAEFALATINTPNRWTSAITYELPFGKGRTFLSSSHWLDYAVGGWSLSINTTMQSGFPLAIYQVNTNSSIGTSTQRPNATGTSPATSGAIESRIGNYINPAAFSIAPQYTYGNVSRTIPMRGPGQAFTDLSLSKSITLFERFKMLLKGDVFNLTNTPVFYGPNTQVGTATFGQITSQANFPRIIQAGVRFLF